MTSCHFPGRTQETGPLNTVGANRNEQGVRTWPGLGGPWRGWSSNSIITVVTYLRGWPTAEAAALSEGRIKTCGWNLWQGYFGGKSSQSALSTSTAGYCVRHWGSRLWRHSRKNRVALNYVFNTFVVITLHKFKKRQKKEVKNQRSQSSPRLSSVFLILQSMIFTSGDFDAWPFFFLPETTHFYLAPSSSPFRSWRHCCFFRKVWRPGLH